MVFSNHPRSISSHSRKKTAPHSLRNVSTITIAISLFSLMILSAISTKLYYHLDFGSNGNASKKVTKARPTIVRPKKWETFDHNKMRTYFECKKAFKSARPWWTDQEWRIVRELYQDLLKSERAGLVRGSTKIGTYQASDEAGKEKGRGLKAAKDIKKGDMIFKATNNTVWAWVQDLEGGAFGIEVDLDDCNLLNSGHRSANIQCGKADDICDGSHFYARRDIKKGEEILGSYSEFVSDHSWSELGL
eukprot:scaffold18707_cov80-Skeletonema_dohrnii-CCMP3373.AAC.3